MTNLLFGSLLQPWHLPSCYSDVPLMPGLPRFVNCPRMPVAVTECPLHMAGSPERSLHPVPLNHSSFPTSSHKPALSSSSPNALSQSPADIYISWLLVGQSHNDCPTVPNASEYLLLALLLGAYPNSLFGFSVLGPTWQVYFTTDQTVVIDNYEHVIILIEVQKSHRRQRISGVNFTKS